MNEFRVVKWDYVAKSGKVVASGNYSDCEKALDNERKGKEYSVSIQIKKGDTWKDMTTLTK